MNNLRFYLVAVLTVMCCSSRANINLPSFFSDNMVLQRNADVTIWGWSNPGEEITLNAGWTKEVFKTKGDNHATWKIILKTPQAGGPYIINIKGYNEVSLTNVMIGEVWLCSGQSNMAWSASAGIDNATEEIAKAKYPDIRFFSVPLLAAATPQLNVPGNWQECTPETMKYFSAIGYFFAQRLREDLKNVPIGIINSSWGGTPAEIWIPDGIISNDKVLSQAASKLKPAEWGPIEPGYAYNTMIHPFAGFKIAGFLWYQGESNVGSEVYNKTLSALIKSWRDEWKENLPFYYVQIAPYNYGSDYPSGVIIRNAQHKVLSEVPNTAMVVISDISVTDDIHPRNKKPVGIRLAEIALQSNYKLLNKQVNSPLYKSAKATKNTLTITFDNAEGLHFTTKKSTQFEVAGTDKVFYTATAKIKNNTVIISSAKVQQPRYVRYGWSNTAQPDLFNKAELPASSFLSE